MASKWFADKFRELLKKYSTKEDLDEVSHNEYIAEGLERYARLFSPEGQTEEPYTSVFAYAGRNAVYSAGTVLRRAEKASERQRPGQPSLKQSWDTRIRERGDDGTRIELTTRAPHAKWVIFGTRKHRIPLSGKARPLLFFNWRRHYNLATGKQWGPTAKHQESRTGWRKFHWVDHPGISPMRRFMPDLKAMTKGRFEDSAERTYGKWLENIHKDSGFKEA